MKDKCEYESRCSWSNYGKHCPYTCENSKPQEDCSRWMIYRLKDLGEKLGYEKLSRLLEPRVENKDEG